MRNIVLLLVLGCAGAGAFGKAHVLADFEGAADVALWKGSPVRQTTAHSSLGPHGMSFDIPNWVKEQGDPRPGVYLELPGRLGEIKWREYESIALDVWMDGATVVCDFGIKLVDVHGVSSWTTHVDLEKPGEKVHAVLTMVDAGADCDLDHVAQIVLYSLRPDAAFTLTVDNLCLIPKKPAVTTALTLEYPNYRGLIFPEGPPIRVGAHAGFPKGRRNAAPCYLEVSAKSGGVSRLAKARIRAGCGKVELGHAGFVPGPVALTARIVQGPKTLDEKKWTLTELSPEEAAGLKSYIDPNKNLIVDGKPFFPLGWYTNTKLDYLAEVADGPFNTLLAYGTDFVPREKMIAFLDAMQAKHMKLIYCANDLYPTSKYFDNKNWEGLTRREDIIPAIINAYKDHPAVLAWYLNDELPREIAPKLEQYYDTFKRTDPNHPCYIVLCHNQDFPFFKQTTDVMGGDTYPIPHESVVRVANMVDRMNDSVGHVRPSWFVAQAFAWYQYHSKDPNRGHAPTELELQTGRAPTFEEVRSMTFLTLAHGAKGLLYYCYYDLRVLPQYEEMWAWMKTIGQQVKDLTPVLLNGRDVPASEYSASGTLHTRLIEFENSLYLIAANPGHNAQDATFKLKRKIRGPIGVEFEDRTVAGQSHTFRDAFETLAVHVYRIPLSE